MVQTEKLGYNKHIFWGVILIVIITNTTLYIIICRVKTNLQLLRGFSSPSLYWCYDRLARFYLFIMMRWIAVWSECPKVWTVIFNHGVAVIKTKQFRRLRGVYVMATESVFFLINQWLIQVTFVLQNKINLHTQSVWVRDSTGGHI